MSSKWSGAMSCNIFCVRVWQVCLLVLVHVAIQGCSIGDVPASLRVDTGNEPAYRDDDVRFRTTYYFRVVDSCRVNDGKDANSYDTDRAPFKVRKNGKLKIVNDTLYRFRMTGKGSALFNQIHFESGVLRAEQIDPFGTAVVLDEASNVFKVKLASTFREEDRRNDLQREVAQLRVLYRDMQSNTKEEPELFDLAMKSTLKAAIQAKIQLLATGSDTSPPQDVPGAESSSSSKAASSSVSEGEKTKESKPAKVESQSKVGEPPKEAEKTKNKQIPSILCPEGRPAKQSYLLYGPGGVRELDPDERLLMAMSSNSKPLISLLQELSGRQLRESQRMPSGMQGVVNERAWLFDLKKKLSKAEKTLESNAELEETPTSSQLIEQLLIESRHSPDAVK